MPTIEGGELGLIQTLHDGHHRGIHESDISVRVPIAQLPDPSVVGQGQVLHGVRAVSDVTHQRDHRAWVKMKTDQEVDLHEPGSEYLTVKAYQPAGRTPATMPASSSSDGSTNSEPSGSTTTGVWV